MEYPLVLDRNKIAEKLDKKNASASCPYCGKNDWEFLKEAAIISQWTNIITPPGIPVSMMICSNCGNVRLNALGSLKLLPKAEDTKEDSNEQ